MNKTSEAATATVDQLTVLFPHLIPKNKVMRFDVDDADKEALSMQTIYIKRDAWTALGEPKQVRLTITAA